jgi:hypothetical protein
MMRHGEDELISQPQLSMTSWLYVADESRIEEVLTSF